MSKVPLLSGSRVVLVPTEEGDVLLRPPEPPEHVADVTAAVRDALRFPLSGPPLEAIAPRGGRATIVVDQRSLPLPGVERDPRADALAAAVRALEHSGVRGERQTVLVAGGLGRRPGPRELAQLLPPQEARGFRGRVLVHDAEDPSLVSVGDGVAVNPALVETDLVLVVGAAETVTSGGPGTLAAACDARTLATAEEVGSLLEATVSPAWQRALRLERALVGVAPLLGVSLVLDLPRLAGRLRGYPHDPAAVGDVGRSWARALFSRLPASLRRDLLSRQARTVAATAAFAGAPSVAHSEALLRGIELRGVRVPEPVDALVVGAPWMGLHAPHEPANPVTAAAVALGYALRLHRNAPAVRDGGTLILVHPLTRSFSRPDAPYAALLNALRAARDGADIAQLEQAAARDGRAIAAYRSGRACHPLLPYADWTACGPTLERVGRVVVAGCRDAMAARALGFVPSHGIASALEMAHGVEGGRARVGVLLAPPYPPLIVGEPPTRAETHAAG